MITREVRRLHRIRVYTIQTYLSSVRRDTFTTHLLRCGSDDAWPRDGSCGLMWTRRGGSRECDTRLSKKQRGMIYSILSFYQTLKLARSDIFTDFSLLLLDTERWCELRPATLWKPPQICLRNIMGLVGRLPLCHQVHIVCDNELLTAI